MKRKASPGMTLVELCIVLMLVAIVSLMVVSFSTIISSLTKNNAHMRAAMGEVTVIRSSTSDWVAFYDSSDYTLSSEGAVLYATATNDPEVRYSISYSDGMFMAEYPDHTVELPFDTVNSATFVIARSVDDGRALVRCIVDYSQVTSNFTGNRTSKTTDFCFARRSATSNGE